MRRIIVKEGTIISLREGEIDWFPVSLYGHTHHLIANNEDFCRNKDEKLRRRKQKRQLKYTEAQEQR